MAGSGLPALGNDAVRDDAVGLARPERAATTTLASPASPHDHAVGHGTSGRTVRDELTARGDPCLPVLDSDGIGRSGSTVGVAKPKRAISAVPASPDTPRIRAVGVGPAVHAVRMWIAAWCDYLIVALACDIVCLDMPGRATTAVCVGLAVRVGSTIGLAKPEWVIIAVCVCDAVRVCDTVCVGLAIRVGYAIGLAKPEWVTIAVCVCDAIRVCDAVCVGLAVHVGYAIGLAAKPEWVIIAVCVCDAVRVCDTVRVGLAVRVGYAVGLAKPEWVTTAVCVCDAARACDAVSQHNLLLRGGGRIRSIDTPERHVRFLRCVG
jgi:hypothetical protein